MQSAKCLNLVAERNAYSQAWSCSTNRNKLNTQKATGSTSHQPINKYSSFDGFRSFIDVLTKASPPDPIREPEESNPRTHFRLRLPIYFFFFSGFLIKILYAFLIQLIGLFGTRILYFVMRSRQNIRQCTHTNVTTYGDPNHRSKNEIKIRKYEINNKKDKQKKINNIPIRKFNYQNRS